MIKKMSLVLILAIVLVPLCGIAMAGEKLKFAHSYEPSEPFHKWAVWAADEIKNRTDGRYEIAVYPASSLGKEGDINEGLTLGTIDLIYTSSAFLGRVYKPIGIGGAPYMFRDYDHFKKYIHSDLYLNTLCAGYKKVTGNTIVATLYYGSRHVTSNKPIRTPADMKGLKIRVPNAPVWMMFPKAVGANPTPIAFAEVYLALQSGTVDAQENPLPTIKAKKLYEVQKFINLTGHIINDIDIIAGGHRWNRLSENDKVIFKQVFQKAAESCSNDILSKEASLVPWFEEQGVTIISDVDVKAMRDATVKIHNVDNLWPIDIYNRLQEIK